MFRNQWWYCFQPRHWHKSAVDKIRDHLTRPSFIPPNRTGEEERTDNICHNSHAFNGLTSPNWYSLEYHQLERTHLQAIVREKDQWMERYPGAACLHLAYQYIEICMSKLVGIKTIELESFVNDLCGMLQRTIPTQHERFSNVDVNRSKITLQGLQIMHQFMITKAKEVKFTGRFSEEDIQPLVDFTETLFTLLTSTALECDTLFAVWNLLQVVV